jgi:hypothetical protein
MKRLLAALLPIAVPSSPRRSASLVAGLLAPLLLASCVTLRAPDTTPRPGGCVSETLNGVWTSRHTTLFGPTWQKLVLRPDCRYYVRYQLLFMRIAARGTYSIEGDTIRVNDRVLRYEHKGRTLVIEENSELISYTRQ